VLGLNQITKQTMDHVHIMIKTTEEKKKKFKKAVEKEGYTQSSGVREAVKEKFKVII